MLLPSPLTNLLRQTLRGGPRRGAFQTGIVLGSLVLCATGCGGCDQGVLECNGGQCQYCDTLGCRPASPTSVGGTGGGVATTGHSGGAGGASASGWGGSAGGSTKTIADAAPVCDPSTAVCACDSAGSCPQGKNCVGGLCIVGCSYSYECGGGGVCFNGACIAACDTTTPCAAGYKCLHGGCVVDTSNPACSAANPCAKGEICVGGFCTSGCTSTSQCAHGEVCDGTTGLCVADQSIKPTCTAGGSLQCPTTAVCGADGFCHYLCKSAVECVHIQKWFVACSAAGYCETAAEANPECTLQSPCPTGMNCVSNTCQ